MYLFILFSDTKCINNDYDMVFLAHERGTQRQFQRLAADLANSFLQCTIPDWDVFNRETFAAGSFRII